MATTTFMGIKNVRDAEPIIENGCTVGFNVYIETPKKVRYGKKELIKNIESVRTVYIKDFDPSSVKGDGSLHGFGKPTIYKKSSPLKDETSFYKFISGMIAPRKHK